MRKTALLILIAALCIPFFSGPRGAMAARNWASAPGPKIDPQVQASLDGLQPGEMTTVILTLKRQADLSQIGGPDPAARQQGVIRALQAIATATQGPVLDWLSSQQSQGSAGRVQPLWIFNGLSVTATAGVIQGLAARADVAGIAPDAIRIVPAGLPASGLASAPASPLAAGAPEANLSAINAPALWSLGYQGQGVVVANMDSGVDASHPDLAARWRGGSNSWFDPYGQHPSTPTDLTGHGTATMGVMLGGEVGGSAIGVAPQAQWIAVKIFNDAGSATATAIHQGYQWLLDPDGNPATADAPRVVNNSWAYGSPGCNLEFQLDLQGLRAAGILPVFAAGNYGPGGATSVSPANYPEALAVGAVDNSGQIYAASSRGPSTCGQAQGLYPALAAPGVDIRSSDLFGLYSVNSGTSLSAPHAAGALALLLSAFPNLDAWQQASALSQGAHDLGTAGPDNDTGYGLLDALASYQWLLAGGASWTPTPAPTATATPAPTATPTANPGQLFSDGFEAGSLAAWPGVTNPSNRLSVTSQAALVGSYGMQALINSTSATYVQDTSPAAETAYHARFYFAPNSVSIASRKQHDLFDGLNAAGTVVLRVQVAYSSGSYQVRAVARLNSGKETATNWYPLSNRGHAIEIAWQAASTSSGTNGALSLWLDGKLLQTSGGLANGSLRVDEARLGPQGLSSGIGGTEFFDAFSSNRSTVIGP